VTRGALLVTVKVSNSHWSHFILRLSLAVFSAAAHLSERLARSPQQEFLRPTRRTEPITFWNDLQETTQYQNVEYWPIHTLNADATQLPTGHQFFSHLRCSSTQQPHRRKVNTYYVTQTCPSQATRPIGWRWSVSLALTSLHAARPQTCLHRMACLFTSQLSLVLIVPTHRGMIKIS